MNTAYNIIILYIHVYTVYNNIILLKLMRNGSYLHIIYRIMYTYFKTTVEYKFTRELVLLIGTVVNFSGFEPLIHFRENGKF